MAKSYIWQQSDWPKLRWQAPQLLESLGLARKQQGRLQAQFETYDLKSFSEFVVQDAVDTAAIEGENYNPDTVRSSVARRLGLPTAGLSPQQQKVDGLVEMLLDATTNFASPLTQERLFGWHAGLFPTGHSGIQKITVANWRAGDAPMQVVSGPMGKETIHYEAPPSPQMAQEMTNFLKWWRDWPQGLDGLLRAGVAHFWFVTIHPFDDGNGRIARAITDLALAQDERTGLRLYSLSSQISKRREDYYGILEQCQSGSCDITAWLVWFLNTFNHALADADSVLKKVKTIESIWARIEQSSLNPRQIKVLKKLLEAEPKGFEGGMTNKKYVAITKTSPESAKRDLADLVKRDFITKNPGGGRSVSYSVKK